MCGSTPNIVPETILVVAGVLRDEEGRVLLARRHPSSHQGGLWEFPGGKVEPGEGAEQALQRELQEELGVEPLRSRPLIRVAHDYGDRRVVLDTWLVERWRGHPRGREGQPLEWAGPAALEDYPMPPADRPIVTALRLPSVYVITPPEVEGEAHFLCQLEATLRAGAKLVQLRVPGMDPSAWKALARRVRVLCEERGARLVVNAAPEAALEVGAHGVHLNGRRLMAMESLETCNGLLVSASCHNVEELLRAQSLGVDFAVLSPVLPTGSHPGARPMGWEAFARMVAEVSLPVYALGGMTPELVERAWRAGGQGVAGISGFWRSRAD